MTTEIQTPVIAYSILEAIKGESGISYSSLLNMESVINRYPDVNEFVQEVHKLIALNFIKGISETTPEEGEDYRLYLTERGKSILNYAHE